MPTGFMITNSVSIPTYWTTKSVYIPTYWTTKSVSIPTNWTTKVYLYLPIGLLTV